MSLGTDFMHMLLLLRRNIHRRIAHYLREMEKCNWLKLSSRHFKRDSDSFDSQSLKQLQQDIALLPAMNVATPLHWFPSSKDSFTAVHLYSLHLEGGMNCTIKSLEQSHYQLRIGAIATL